MMKKPALYLLLLLCYTQAWSQQSFTNLKPVKNVILLIPDGTSMGVIAAARWYQFYNEHKEHLNLDPYLCGTVRTTCSNAPIGDSAPTTSCYMTGMLSKAGNIAIYPVADPENDLIKVDPSEAYQPLTTILEAVKMEQKKATGLVVTCEFPHATPADCSAHYYDRSSYKSIAPQMAYNNLDVMFGGGTSIVTDDMKDHFRKTNTLYQADDIAAFRAFDGDQKIWSLFCPKDIPFDLDRDDSKYPSLAEMTQKAITRLNKNQNGFFLMVEGSKVDWAAHANDAVGCITEFLAFDKAVGVALDFAKKDGNTAIVILSDHGNSGFTIGRRGMPKKYAEASISELFGTVSGYKRTSSGMEEVLRNTKPADYKSVFKQYTNIDLTDSELQTLLKNEDKKETDYTKMSYSENLRHAIMNIMNEHTPFGFTTGGHTGEDVQLAVYNPNGETPKGMTTNIEINSYLFHVLGLETPLSEMTKKMYAKHTDVFKGMNYKLNTSSDPATLTVKKGKKTLVVEAFKSVALLNNKPIDLGSVAVYIDKDQTFYLPADLVDKLK